MILNYSVVRFFALYYAGHVITLVGFVAISFYAVYKVNTNSVDEFLKMSVEKENRRHLDDLEKYSAGRKSFTETLRSFRHDYTTRYDFA